MIHWIHPREWLHYRRQAPFDVGERLRLGDLKPAPSGVHVTKNKPGTVGAAPARPGGKS